MKEEPEFDIIEEPIDIIETVRIDTRSVSYAEDEEDAEEDPIGITPSDSCRYVFEKDPLGTKSSPSSSFILDSSSSEQKKPTIKVTKTYSNRSKRKQTSSIKVQYVCDKCKLVLSSAELLKSHVECVHNKREKGINSRKIHKVTSSPPSNHNRYRDRPYKLRPLSCNVCYVDFGSHQEVQEHQKVHLVPNAYACHLCEEKFDSEFTAHHHLYSAHNVPRK